VGGKGREEALSLLDNVSTPDGRFRVRWVDGDVPPAPVFSRERHYTDVPIRVRGQAVGFVELSESLAYEQAYVRDTLVRAAWATLAAVLVAALLAAALGFYMVGRPLAKLAQKARSIGAGDLSGTLNLKQRDEIGQLAREFDAMCDSLAQARVSLAGETEARVRAIEQLRHADRLATVGKLASGIAHEVGTPLGVALVRANMISSGRIGGDEAREGLALSASRWSTSRASSAGFSTLRAGSRCGRPGKARAASRWMSPAWSRRHCRW